MPTIISILCRYAAPAFCLAAFGLAPPLLADEARPSKPALTLQNFGRGNPACLEWTNACAVCRRLEPRPARVDRPWSRRGGVRFACSTPGIACLPRDLVCSRAAFK